MSEITIPETGNAVLKFGADWCGPCKHLKPLIEELKEENKDMLFLDIDVDEYPDLAQKFGVRGIPMTVFLRDGEVLSSVVGVKPKAEFQEHINLLGE